MGKKPGGRSERLVVLAKDLRRGCISPGSVESVADIVLFRRLEEYHRCPAFPPRTACGFKSFGSDPEKRCLLVGRKFRHSLLTVGRDRGKDLSSDAKIGMRHMGALFGLGETQGKGPKFVCGHFNMLCPLTIISQCVSVPVYVDRTLVRSAKEVNGMTNDAIVVFHGFLNLPNLEKLTIVEGINDYFDSMDREPIRAENEDRFAKIDPGVTGATCKCCGR